MKKNLIKYGFLAISGLTSFIFSLILYIKSYEIWQDEYGSDISFNEDYIIAMVVSILIVVYAVYAIWAEKQNHATLAYEFCGICSSALISFYSLGVLFKNLNKGKDFKDYTLYFYLGIVTLFLLAYFISCLISKKDFKKK